jgi:hypothetical protein
VLHLTERGTIPRGWPPQAMMAGQVFVGEFASVNFKQEVGHFSSVTEEV